MNPAEYSYLKNNDRKVSYIYTSLANEYNVIHIYMQKLFDAR